MFIVINLVGDEDDTVVIPVTPDGAASTEEGRIAWEEELLRREPELQVVVNT